jgi:anthranilate phosphoribosyltransferase
MTPDQQALHALAGRADLAPELATALFDRIMEGGVSEAVLGALLMGLLTKGETVVEIEAAVRAVRARMTGIAAPAGAIDTCGTGGDNSGSRNVSTAVAILVAACGVPVAKHGNRALSSKSGSSDVLAALGINLDAPLSVIERGLAELGIAFLLAPRHHAAMRHVGPVRTALGLRTIFNFIGPLANPAGVTRQLLGVSRADLVEPVAEVLGRLGSTRAWVVHGAGGLDEISTLGPTQVADLRDGVVTRFTLDPADWHIPQARLEDLRGGDAADNAQALTRLLAGEPGPYRDIVLLNAAAALVVADAAPDITSGLTQAADAIDTGAGADLLARWVAFSQSSAAA